VIEHANDAGEVAPLHLAGGLCGKVFKGRGIRFLVWLDGGSNILVAVWL
jgi:hypothetical protein